MLNFGILEKGLVIVSSPHFMHDFSKRMFPMLPGGPKKNVPKIRSRITKKKENSDKKLLHIIL